MRKRALFCNSTENKTVNSKIPPPPFVVSMQQTRGDFARKKCKKVFMGRV
jgi:hypothetical protein